MNKEIRKVGIIGGGRMGTNLFNFLLDFGFEIIWVCHREAVLENTIKSFNKKISRSLKAGIMDESTYSYLQENTLITIDHGKTKDCDLVIEAVSEDLILKQTLFGQLDELVNDSCILASNSSSFIPSELLQSETRKDKMIGLHFFYPVSLKSTVEFIVTDQTSDETAGRINRFLTKINHEPLLLSEENGFILNKIFLDIQNEAFLIVKEDEISYRQMDALIKKHLFPVGAFDFCDSVGNDIMLTSVRNYVRNYTNRNRYLPFINTLETLVAGNKLGVKSGAGFYSCTEEPVNDDDMIKEIPPDVIEKAILRLGKIIAMSIQKFSAMSGISSQILTVAMKDYLDTENDFIFL